MKKITFLLFIACAIQAMAADYQPLVREGVRWHYNFSNFSGDIHLQDYNYYYEFRGETVINGNVYKNLYRTVSNGAVEEPSMPEDMRFPLHKEEEKTTLVGYMIEKDKVVYSTVPESGYRDCQQDNNSDLGVVVYDFNQSKENLSGYYNIQGVKCNQYYIQNPDTYCWADPEEIEVWKDPYYVYLVEGIGYIYPEDSYYDGDFLYPYDQRATCCLGTAFLKVTDTADNVIFDPYSPVSGINDVKVGATATDSRYYNLQGQAVDIKIAPAGIYIHNGKKIVVK